MSNTYQQLIEEHRLRIEKRSPAAFEQVARNHASTLNGFLTFCGKGLSNRVGREMFADFDYRLSEYLKAIPNLSPKTRSDKASHLRAIRRTAVSILEDQLHVDCDSLSAFHQALRSAFARAGKKPKTVARESGASASAVQRWVAGAYPNQTGLRSLRRIEVALGLERGYLEGLLPSLESAPEQRQFQSRYQNRLAAAVKSRYWMPEKELSTEFLCEWSALLTYKTSPATFLKRNPRGIWRVIARSHFVGKVSKLETVQANLVCPTAGIFGSALRSYFGFLALSPATNGAECGLGLPKETVQCLAIVAIPELLQAYFEFVRARSDGVVHQGHSVFAGSVASLVKAGTGYLYQQPQLFDRIQQYCKGRSHTDLCNATADLCASWKRAAVAHSRDPKSSILPLLKLDSPLAPLLRAVRDMDLAAAKAFPGGVQQATIKRDALLLDLAISHPLRARTFSIIRYVQNGQLGLQVPEALRTNLYRVAGGQWRLRLDANELKNGSARGAAYDAAIPQRLVPRLEEFLYEYRPVLLGSGATVLFPSSKHGGPMSDIGKVFERLSKRYIPEIDRFRSHAIRHIVATDFLNQNPGEYTVIAELLHDSLNTVLGNYAHLKQEASFKAHEKHVERLLAKNKR